LAAFAVTPSQAKESTKTRPLAITMKRTLPQRHRHVTRSAARQEPQWKLRVLCAFAAFAFATPKPAHPTERAKKTRSGSEREERRRAAPEEDRTFLVERTRKASHMLYPP